MKTKTFCEARLCSCVSDGRPSPPPPASAVLIPSTKGMRASRMRLLQPAVATCSSPKALRGTYDSSNEPSLTKKGHPLRFQKEDTHQTSTARLDISEEPSSHKCVEHSRDHTLKSHVRGTSCTCPCIADRRRYPGCVSHQQNLLLRRTTSRSTASSSPTHQFSAAFAPCPSKMAKQPREGSGSEYGTGVVCGDVQMDNTFISIDQSNRRKCRVVESLDARRQQRRVRVFLSRTLINAMK